MIPGGVQRRRKHGIFGEPGVWKEGITYDPWSCVKEAKTWNLWGTIGVWKEGTTYDPLKRKRANTTELTENKYVTIVTI